MCDTCLDILENLPSVLAFSVCVSVKEVTRDISFHILLLCLC